MLNLKFVCREKKRLRKEKARARRGQEASTVTLASLSVDEDDDAASNVSDQDNNDVDFGLLDESLHTRHSLDNTDEEEPQLTKRPKLVDVEAEAERLLGIQ